MNRHLNVICIRHVERMVNDRRCCAPVLVNLESHRARLNLLRERTLIRAVALSQKSQIHGIFLRRLEHHADVPCAGRAGGRIGSVRRTGAAADHGRDAGIQRTVHLLRTDIVNVRINRAGGDNQILARERLGGGTHRHARCHAVHEVGIARLADSGNFSVLDADIRLINAGIVQNQRVGNHQIQHAVRAARLDGLSHSVPKRLAAAELRLLAVGGQILLHLDDQIGVCQPNPVSGRRAEHHCIFVS